MRTNGIIVMSMAAAVAGAVVLYACPYNNTNAPQGNFGNGWFSSAAVGGATVAQYSGGSITGLEIAEGIKISDGQWETKIFVEKTATMFDASYNWGCSVHSRGYSDVEDYGSSDFTKGEVWES